MDLGGAGEIIAKIHSPPRTDTILDKTKDIPKECVLTDQQTLSYRVSLSCLKLVAVAYNA